MAGWAADRLGRVPGLRLIDARWLHVTLCFLGWREVGEVEGITAACRAALALEPLPLSLGEAVWLPPRRPRVVAVALLDASGGLARLQTAVSAALAAGGFYEPEGRPYLGHVTLARVGRGVRVRAEPLPPPTPVSFDAEAVTLYQSRLERGGARYEALETMRLGHPRENDGQ